MYISIFFHSAITFQILFIFFNIKVRSYLLSDALIHTAEPHTFDTGISRNLKIIIFFGYLDINSIMGL